MSREDNRRIAARVMEELNAGRLDGVTDLCAPDCTFHGWAPETLDRNGYRQAMSGLLAAFDNPGFPVDEIVADEEHVAVRHRFQGTHTGEFMGVTPSSKSVEIAGIVLFRIQDGMIAEAWLNADMLGILQQIGAIPSAEPEAV